MYRNIIQSFSLLCALLAVWGVAAAREGSGRALATLDSVALTGETKVLATTGNPADQFGAAVCKLGNYTVIGQPFDDAGSPNGGMASVPQR